MRHSFGTFVLVVFALFFLLTAWSSGVAPKEFAQSLGLTIANADGFNEIRAQYAGFFLVSSVMCVAALAGWISRQSVFILVSVIFGGLIAGRLTSLVLNNGMTSYGSMILALYLVDATGFALAITASILNRKI